MSKRWLDKFLRFLRRKRDDDDPYSYVRVPLRKGPSNLQAAAKADKPRD